MDKGASWRDFTVIKGREIGYKLRVGYAKTLLSFHVTLPMQKYKRAFFY
jgi:hypothetical protein